MSGQNENMHRRPLTFSGKQISAELVQGVENYTVQGRRIVLNLGSNPMFLPDCPTQSVRPLQSTILIDAEIRRVETAIIVCVADDVVSGKLIDDLGWDLYADLVEKPSAELRATPLFRSSQDTVGSRIFDASALGVVTRNPNAIERFEVKINLWFAPAGTNCLIHRYHSFAETHLQILGSGRMQKFRDQSFDDLYEEIFMSPGFIQPFFHCVRDDANGFEYPWHQYYAETDCVWMAIEFHPLASAVKAAA